MDARPREPLRRYFAGIAEYTFHTQLGVADIQVIDYISDLLTRFIRSDVVFKIRNLTGLPLTEVAAMLIEAEERIGDARREVHRHVGDFTLFWTGVYPEALHRLRDESRKDHLLEYREQGKRSYRIASAIKTDEQQTNAPGELLGRMSEQFDLLAYGLGEVRRQWEHRGDNNLPQPIILN
jgi:hypothetical protein